LSAPVGELEVLFAILLFNINVNMSQFSDSLLTCRNALAMARQVGSDVVGEFKGASSSVLYQPRDPIYNSDFNFFFSTVSTRNEQYGEECAHNVNTKTYS